MSLNWNIGNIANWKSTCFDRLPLAGNEDLLDKVSFFGPDWCVSKDNENEIERVSPTTFSLIFATMSVGLPEITTKNVDEFMRRLSVIESMGALRRDGDGNDVPFTFEEVRAHIGLSTNASSKTTRQFNAQMARELLRRAEKLAQASA